MNTVKSTFSFSYSLVLLLFFSMAFILPETESSDTIMRIQLPAYVPKYASIIRWAIFGIMTGFSLLYIKKIKIFAINKRFIFLFYFFLFFYSIISFTDVLRYLSLWVLIISIPFFVENALLTFDIHKALGLLCKCIIIVFLLSIIIGIVSIINGYRFCGTMNNPNAYSSLACFWISILLIQNKYISIKKINLIFVALILISILLSGSRNGVIFATVIILFALNKNIKPMIILFAFLPFFLLVFDKFFNIDFLFNRYENITIGGRETIWEQALLYIKQGFWGYGMNSPVELLGVGNVHNCYLRFLLMMGVFFTILIVFSYLLFIISLFAKRNKTVPKSLIGFVIAYAIANSAEDYFVGVGSAMLIAFCLILGFIFYFQHANNIGR